VAWAEALYFCQFLGADVRAHRAFCPAQFNASYLLSILCTFVIEQINDDDD